MAKYKLKPGEKFAVYSVMGPKCVWCNRPVDYAECEIDHIIPESLLNKPIELKAVLKSYKLRTSFDLNSFENFGPMHRGCNNIKTNILDTGAPYIGHLLLRIKKRVSEMKRVQTVFLQKHKGSKVLAHIELALAKKTVEVGDVHKIISKGPKDLHGTVKSNFPGYRIRSISKTGAYGNKIPKQLYNINYEEVTSNKQDFVEHNAILKAKSVQELFIARENYFSFLKDIDVTDDFFKTNSYYEFGMQYSLISKSVLSYTETTRVYNTGAAHDLYAITGQNYLLNPLRPLKLEDYIDDIDGFVRVITPIAYEKMVLDLKERDLEINFSEYSPIDMQWLLESDSKPFRNYHLTHDAIVFIFNPYEVSAWVYGAHFPAFSYKELWALIPHEKRLLELLKIFSKDRR